MNLEVIAVTGIPIIEKGDSLAEFILEALQDMDVDIQDEDILVIAETAIAKAEGNIINLKSLKPNPRACELADKTGKSPEVVEAILQESVEVIAVGPNFIISETKHGFVCANAGLDESNVDEGLATPIPPDPDGSASHIWDMIREAAGKDVSIVISDTQGRAFREGAVGVAIGISGLEPLWDRSGEKDLYDRELKTTAIAIADELAATASIVMGQADEGIPVVLIRGVVYPQVLKNDSASIKPLIRPKEHDVFRP